MRNFNSRHSVILVYMLMPSTFYCVKYSNTQNKAEEKIQALVHNMIVGIITWMLASGSFVAAVLV